MTFEKMLQGMSDEDLKNKISCMKKQCDTGITINSDVKLKEDWLNDPMCGGAILDKPCDTSVYEDALARRDEVRMLGCPEGTQPAPNDAGCVPIPKSTITITETASKTAGFGGNMAMFLIVGGFLYYAYSQGLLTKK
tara:strand:- start:168 stop:578 length:411 start_codon:yes stop_codon:yes gene_type:complete